MPVIPAIAQHADELVSIRRDLHQHPEIGMQEVRTSRVVAEQLQQWGIEVHTGIGNTGVVGIVHGKLGQGPSIGLRADMDALPIHENTNLPYASNSPGVMHACGHDAHTTMLLGAARYLAETRNFKGTVVLIFQPAEEGLGGAKAMLADELFKRFPCDEIYGMHNKPDGKPGTVGVKPGIAMAGGDFFDIRIEGAGTHAARPHEGIDAIVVATNLVQQLQSIVSRNVPATETVVLSVTQIHAGSAYNVIPAECTISGTLRFFDQGIAASARKRMKSLCDGAAMAYGVTVDYQNREIFDVLINNEKLSQAMLDAAGDIVGAENVSVTPSASTGSEDFADMLRVVPGAYCTVGHEGTYPLHSDQFFLDESILPVGASIYARVVEQRTSASA